MMSRPSHRRPGATRRRATLAVGVFAYNEEATLEACVRAVLDQEHDAELVELVVVSSGSTDATDVIAARLAAEDSRVHVLVEPSRRGKAHAINVFLERAADVDRVVLVGGDVVLERGALSALLAPLDDPRVGMSGGRPVPQNARRGVGQLVHLLWELHDGLSRRAPKLGEAIALRTPITPLPEWTCADEAALEADVVRRGLRLAYCPEALLHNRGPATLTDYLRHRRRIARAHSEIAACGYRPATRDLGAVAAQVAAYGIASPRALGWLAAAAAIEAWAWAVGALDARGPRESAGVWAPIRSAKRPIARTPTAEAAPRAAAPSPMP